MTLIKSISGIRGTIGGPTGDTLNPLDIVKFTSAYATFIANRHPDKKLKIVVGRDARISGQMVQQTVCGTLIGIGANVLDIGLASTPTTELAVTATQAQGGIIITASHNPRNWNALKLLNENGEFLTANDGNQILSLAQHEAFTYADIDNLGTYTTDTTSGTRHIDSVLALKLVDTEAIRNRRFRVVVDAINSVGAIILPQLLDRLGVEYKLLNGQADGNFAHDPEPIEKNLSGIMNEISTGNYDLGIVVDPDVDRLAFIQEDGKMFGEEYTLVSVADYVLQHTPGNTVSNLSSTRALRDITLRHGNQYHAAAVGEVNVTTKMKQVGAIIGGEGNGGIIYPESHYGRDALTGIALFLSSLAQKGITASQLRRTFPEYFIAKNRINLTPETNVEAILAKIKELYSSIPNVTVTDIDGVKLDFADSWVHLRKSNTEPIIRIYSEASTANNADALGKKLMQVVYDMQS
ncbi:MAG: phosphoglucosamine mutase [Prevotella micans]|nr:phosphoglucosamine mutase [Prevotella micans]